MLQGRYLSSNPSPGCEVVTKGVTEGTGEGQPTRWGADTGLGTPRTFFLERSGKLSLHSAPTRPRPSLASAGLFPSWAVLGSQGPLCVPASGHRHHFLQGLRWREEARLRSAFAHARSFFEAWGPSGQVGRFQRPNPTPWSSSSSHTPSCAPGSH